MMPNDQPILPTNLVRLKVLDGPGTRQYGLRETSHSSMRVAFSGDPSD
jgi:hypothetical protein